MQAATRLSSITRYVSLPALLNTVRPSTQITMRRPFSTTNEKEKKPMHWVTATVKDISSPEKENLSYKEKLVLFDQAAPTRAPNKNLTLYNMPPKSTLADIKKVLPNAQAIWTARVQVVVSVEFNSVEDAQNALNIVNSATEYPFGTTAGLIPAYAVFSGSNAAFEANRATDVLQFPRYYGTVEQLKSFLAPFVPAGHELIAECRGSKGWAYLGTTEAAQAANHALNGQGYSAEHVLRVRYGKRKDTQNQNETAAKE